MLLADQILYYMGLWLADGFFFFFQAEDGIRYLTVTGVQTCALPISSGRMRGMSDDAYGLPVSTADPEALALYDRAVRDRKSTRLNSSHSQISYAVFCLKKKKIIITKH